MPRVMLSANFGQNISGLAGLTRGPKSRQGGVSLAIWTNGDTLTVVPIRILTTRVDHKCKSITPVHEISLVYISLHVGKIKKAHP